MGGPRAWGGVGWVEAAWRICVTVQSTLEYFRATECRLRYAKYCAWINGVYC